MNCKLREIVSNKPVFVLLLIIVLGLVLRIISAVMLSIDGDEGQFIYDSHLALQGSIPVRDIVPPPDPLYIWMLAFVELVFGANLFAVRSLSMIFSIVAIVGIYLLTGQLAHHKIALLASLIYSLSPTIVLYNSIGNYRQVAFPMIIVALYFLVAGMKRSSWKSLLLSGVIIGLAALTYRAAAIFVLTTPLLFLMRRENLRSLSKSVGILIFGSLLSVLPVVSFLALKSSFNWVNQLWGFGGGIGSVADFAVTSQTGLSPLQNLVYYFDFRSRVAFVVAREWFYLILPAILGLIFLLKRNERKWSLPVKAFMYFALTLFVLMVLRGQSLPPRGAYGTYDVWPIFDYATMIIVFVGYLLVLGYPRGKMNHAMLGLRDLTVYWLLSLFVAFAVFRIVHVFYFVAFAAVFSILAAMALSTISGYVKLPGTIHDRAKLLSILVLVVIASSAIVAASSAFGTSVLERDVTQNQALAVGDYVRIHTSPNDEIFTGNLIYVVDSGRDNALKISNPWIYLQGPSDPFPGNPYGSTPSIQVLAAYLSTGTVKYVIMDNQLIAMMTQQPILASAISSNFISETQIGSVTISRFNG